MKKSLRVALLAPAIGLVAAVDVERADRRHLGHAPGVEGANPEFFQIVHQGGRHRRTADDDLAQVRQALVLRAQQIADRHPHRRHAGRHGDALALEQLDQTRRIEPFHRHDEVRADHQHGNGVPQALTWKSGTIGSMRSRSPIPIASIRPIASA